MPMRLRKVRKLRGSRTHGWGQVAQHRGKGGRGGYGEAGGHKHKWTRTIVYEPDRFGKLGFKRAWIGRAATINAGELDEVSEELVTRKLAMNEADGIHVDLGVLGVGKLLGEGRVKKALIVKVGSFSGEAKRKIEEAKGRIVSEDLLR